MSPKKENLLTTEKEILGFRPADLLGILIMIIPFVISYAWYKEIPIKFLGIIDIKKTENVNIWPNAVTAAFAVAFYTALIVRYNIFKSNNLIQGFISAIRTFLDCWVLASLLSIVLPTKAVNSISFVNFFQNTQTLLLVFAVVLTWFGMRTIAGYSWIIFIFTASGHLLKVSNAMERLGAIFIITIAISLFLQIKDLSDMKDFLADFKSGTNGFTSQVKGSINEAAYDAARKAYVVTNYIRKEIGVPASQHVPHLTLTPEAPKTMESSTRAMPMDSKVKINLESLDVNKDGVVDEKDFQILQQLGNNEK